MAGSLTQATVVALYPELQNQAAAMLGRAFVDDPLSRAIVSHLGEASARVRALEHLFRALLAINRRSGQPAFGIMVDRQVTAAAVTEGAGAASMFAAVVAGLSQMPRLASAIGPNAIFRAMSGFRVLAANHPAEPHIYLQALGVDPGHQRRHLGSALLEYLRLQASARPDVTGVYLETATEANVAYYSSRGYEVIGEVYPLGVRMWRMYQRTR